VNLQAEHKGAKLLENAAGTEPQGARSVMCTRIQGVNKEGEAVKMVEEPTRRQKENQKRICCN
jgi:hypothetical protein